MDRIAGVLLLFLCGIAIGAGGAKMWEWKEYTDALARERGLIGERDALVSQLATAKSERDAANRRARTERQAIYANDKDAAAWAAQPIPDAIRQRLHDAARDADAAASSTELP